MTRKEPKVVVLCDAIGCGHNLDKHCEAVVIEIKDRGRKYFRPMCTSAEN